MRLPKILDIPKKLLKMVLEFNLFRFFLLEGGRGSGKSHAIARFILFLGEKKKLRIICGREIQNSIEESVYQLLVDIIIEHDLAYDISKSQITHKVSGTTIRFKGFREQGIVQIKSLEGCDILWIEEAQTITTATLDIIIPTIRKNNAKIFFSMNRFVRTDPVYEFCETRNNALTIHIDYFENEFCPANLVEEAETCKKEDPKKYKHIWLGHPLKTTEEYLFDFDNIAEMPFVEPLGDLYKQQSIVSIDYASGGGDLCVAVELRRLSNVHWEVADVIVWDDPDTDLSVGKSYAIYTDKNPDVMIVDASGLGYPMSVTLSKKINNLIAFNGGATDKITGQAANNRAEAYLTYSEWVNKKWLLCKNKVIKKEMETIKKEHQSNGKILIESKKKARKRGVKSPDHSDAVSQAIFAAKHFLGKIEYSDTPIGSRVTRVNKRRR